MRKENMRRHNDRLKEGEGRCLLHEKTYTHEEEESTLHENALIESLDLAVVSLRMDTVKSNDLSTFFSLLV